MTNGERWRRRADMSGWRGFALIACVALLALMLAGASWSAARSAHERLRAEGARDHTLEVLLVSEQIRILTLEAMRGERGYLLTNDPAFRSPYEQALRDRPTAIARLMRLTRDNALQHARALRLQAGTEDYFDILGKVVALTADGRAGDARVMVSRGDGRRAIAVIDEQLDVIEHEEHRLLASSTERARRTASANEYYQYGLAAIGFILIGVCLLAAISVRRAMIAEAQVRDELRLRADTDELTGIDNRRALLAGLRRTLAGGARSGRPFAFAILDIDHFKRVNDSFGHPAGDAVIRAVAERAVDVMRGQDQVGRLGGEEFAIVLPDCRTPDALAACERLRTAIENGPVTLADGTAIAVTVSFGVAGSEGGDTLESLMARADAALYRAKAAGRNRVLLAA